MSMTVPAFEGMMRKVFLTFQKYPNAANEANTIRVQLGADATRHDTTIRTAPAGLVPGHRGNSAVQRAILRLVNAGKAGNLSTITMANIIGGMLPLSPPVNVTPPTMQYQSGGAGAGTQPGALYIRATAGTWDPPSPSLSQQWMRDATAIAGQTTVTYTTVAADAGTTLSCRVTGTNAGGSSTVTATGAAAIT